MRPAPQRPEGRQVLLESGLTVGNHRLDESRDTANREQAASRNCRSDPALTVLNLHNTSRNHDRSTNRADYIPDIVDNVSEGALDGTCGLALHCRVEYWRAAGALRKRYDWADRNRSAKCCEKALRLD